MQTKEKGGKNMEAKDLFNSQQIIEPCFTEEGLSLMEIVDKINNLSVTAFHNTNEKERSNASKKIADLTTKVIQDFRKILKSDLHEHLRQSKLILRALPNKEKEIELLSTIQKNI